MIKRFSSVSKWGVTVCLALAAGWNGFGAFAGEAPPEEWNVTLAPAVAEILCEARAGGLPTIEWEDISAAGRPIGEVRIGNLCLGRRILSGSRFTLSPGSLGIWAYDLGFRAMPKEVRTLSETGRVERIRRDYPWCKRLYDPCAPIESIRTDSGQVRLTLYRGGTREIVYPLDFGPDFEAVGLYFEPWAYDSDGTGDAGIGFWHTPDVPFALGVAVSLDRAGTNVVARQVLRAGTPAPAAGDPFYVPLSGLAKFYVTFRQVEGELSIFAGTRMRVYLRYKGAEWPRLQAGKNVLAYAEKDGTVGRRRVRVSLRQSGAALDLSRGQCTGLVQTEWVQPASDAVDTGTNGYLRITGTPSAAGWSLSLPTAPENRDWRGVRAVRMYYRAPTWCGPLQPAATAVWGGRPDPRFLTFDWQPLLGDTLQPVPQWEVAERELPVAWTNRSDIRDFVVQPWGGAWDPKPTKTDVTPFCLEIGRIDCVPFKPGERDRLDADQAVQAAWAARRASSPIRLRLAVQPLPSGPRIRPRDFLARGIWCMPFDDAPAKFDRAKQGWHDVWEYRAAVFADLKAHHLNACSVEVTQVPEGERDEFVKQAAENGIRLWGCHSSLALMPFGHASAETLATTWRRQMDLWEGLITRYKDVPTWLAWEIGEEPAPEHLPYILEARQILTRLNAQPQIMLYNNPDVLRADTSQKPLPGGACMDSYIFITFYTDNRRYLSYLDATWQGAKRCDGVAWFTPQLIADEGVYATLTRAAMRFQVWAAVAYNVKGFFPWYYTPAKTPDFRDRDFFRFYSDEMGRLETLEKVVLAMERNDDLKLLATTGENTLVGCFTDRTDPAYRFAVVVNLDIDKAKSIPLQPLQPTDCMVRLSAQGKNVAFTRLNNGGALTLEPGDGAIVFIGGADRVASLKARYAP